MKKLTFLFAAVALMAMTACNEKPADNNAATTDAKAPATTEQQAPAANDAQGPKAKVNVMPIEPTSDGKEAVMADFTDAKGTKVKMVNKGDGTVFLQVWVKGLDKDGKPTYTAETKDCKAGKNGFLMKSSDGKIFVVNTKPGAENVTVMNGNQLMYSTIK